MVTWSHTRVMSGGGGKPGPGGVVTAGWGTLHTAHPGQCLHLAHPAYPSPPPSLDPDQFRMSFTKQLVAGAKPSSKRRPVLVSRPRSEPWLPAGAGAGASKQRAGPPGPWCSVCADSSLTKEEVWTLSIYIYLHIYISTYLRIYISTQVDTRRELEREVRLLQSRPSHAYSKHSPRNWSQDNLLGN